MKKIAVIFVSVVLIISTNLSAQDKYHVVLGRLKGSSLAKFEQKNYLNVFLNQMNAEILYKANGINVIGEGLEDAYYKLNPMMV